MNPFPHIRVSGDASQRGRQLGQQAASRITRTVEIYRQIFKHYAGWDWQQVVDHAARFRPAIAAYQPRYLTEMENIAQGAGLDVDDVLAINVRTEIMFTAVAHQARQECTSFAALPEITANEHTLIGQNWDWTPPLSETIIVLEAEQAEGPSFVTVVEAGLLAKTGFNSAGIGLAVNALVTDQDQGQPGVPFHVILRGILDARTMSEALGAVTRQPRSSAGNYLIVHRDGEAIDAEAAPGDYSRVYLNAPCDGFLAHTNHFVSPRFDLKDVGLWTGPDSPIRLNRINRLLRRQGGSITPEALQAIVTDHFNHPNAICRHPDPLLPAPERWATIASIVMDLNDRTMWLADGSPCQTPYRRLDYTALLGTERDV